MNELKAKNKSVERLVKAAQELDAALDGIYEDVKDRYNGDFHWKSAIGTLPVLKKGIKQILMAAGQAIPEDRIYAYAAAGRKEKDHGQASNFIRIKVDENVVVEHCADCPSRSPQPKAGSSNMRTFVKKTSVEPTAREKAKPKEVAEQPKVALEVVEQSVKEPEVNPFPDVDAVLKSFDSDVDMMKAYCEKEGIDIGRRSKAESIAECIVEHHAA